MYDIHVASKSLDLSCTDAMQSTQSRRPNLVCSAGPTLLAAPVKLQGSAITRKWLTTYREVIVKLLVSVSQEEAAGLAIGSHMDK